MQQPVTVSVYLAMILSFVLQRLLQIQAAGQVAFSQVVAELRNTEQPLLRTPRFTVFKEEYTHTQAQAEKMNT